MKKSHITLIKGLLCFSLTIGSTMVKSQWDTLPDRMFLDTVHAPFVYGVASGDPTDSTVLLWSAIEAGYLDTVYYELASDSTFLTTTIANGWLLPDSNLDNTLNLRITGLSADNYYWFRFRTTDSIYSVTGRTRTLPAGGVDSLNIAVVSCSSIFSGYFNAYRQIGNRNDLNFVVHLGDYIYDFVDENEEVRIPSPYPTEPQNISEWRQRHKYYLHDPDLRLARQNHPWFVTWDNHDLPNLSDPNLFDAIQAFQEYVPMQLKVDSVKNEIYRSFKVGDMLDLVLTDILLFSGTDTIRIDTSSIETSRWGIKQFNWLADELETSDGLWRIITSQKMMGTWSAVGMPDWLEVIVPHDGPVMDSSAWDGHNLERTRFFNFLDSLNINDNLVISGDAHISMAMDLSQFPLDSNFYDPTSGQHSVGAEFLPTSVSRGNMDEAGYEPWIGDFAVSISTFNNPHHVYTEMIQHGYGLIRLFPDSILSEYWYCPILSVSNQHQMSKRLRLLKGSNHWEREPVATNIQVREENKSTYPVYPNPSSGRVYIKSSNHLNNIKWIDMMGRVIPIELKKHSNGYILDPAFVTRGVYLIHFDDGENIFNHFVTIINE